MSVYVELDDFSEYVRDQVSGTDDAVKQAALNAAEAMVNEFCQRTFVVASASSARSYTPATATSSILRIHDCTTITSVVENGATTTNYQAEPLNSMSWSGDARPVERLRALGGYWYWFQDELTVTVTATWGWLATPAAVVEATKILAKDLIQQRNNNSGVAGFGDFGAVGVRQNPYVAKLLTPLRRAESFGIG